MFLSAIVGLRQTGKLLCFLLLIGFMTGCYSSQSLNKNATHRKIDDAAAHWLTQNMLAYLPTSVTADVSAYIVAYNEQGEPQQRWQVVALPQNTPSVQRHQQRYPHLRQWQFGQVTLTKADLRHWLKYPLVLEQHTDNGTVLSQSAVQTAEVLDDLYTTAAHDADDIQHFGATPKTHHTDFALWAPTAHKVWLLLYGKDITQQPKVIPMQLEAQSGAWQLRLNENLHGHFYRYRLQLFHPDATALQTLEVTDPYSLSLSRNSQYSQVVDLQAADTQPMGWLQQPRPALAAPEEQVLYEMHIRDFSSADTGLINSGNRGKYGAFLESQSHGVKHLKALHQAGVNTLHLLPVFDIATVNEDPSQRIGLSDNIGKVCKLAPIPELCQGQWPEQQSLLAVLQQLSSGHAVDNHQVQHIIQQLRERDDYNWGYDPWHYSVPEGSYAQEPHGLSRIVEFRRMVQRIHQLGFRVVMDVVYNHTYADGLDDHSVLDKIVPGYYQRRHPVTGATETSTCCPNTATERVMMAKLMTDSLVVWAKDYAIDGFRFDLMGHQPKSLMLKARAAVQAVDPDTYFYGEGWNFGEVANDQRFVQASQLRLTGTEIGTFSDRLRDAVRGGSFSDTPETLRQGQGLGNGLWLMSNEQSAKRLSKEKIKAGYLLLADQVRVGLAGNLADVQLTDRHGRSVSGLQVPYGNAPTGYAGDPADTINYVSKHDNQTLWDHHQYRNAFALTQEQRVDLQLLSLSYVLYGQGIPFLHMGSELLRSKSFLRDSYDYGDWFNQVDFTGAQHNYNVGLPPAEKDRDKWPLIKQVLLGNQGRDHPTQEQILAAKNAFLQMLSVRQSSPLFRLQRAEQIQQMLRFHNTGPKQVPGLIVMSLQDLENLDANWQEVVVLFNNGPQTQQFSYANAEAFQLHPVLKAGDTSRWREAKAIAGQLQVPGFSAAVFVR